MRLMGILKILTLKYYSQCLILPLYFMEKRNERVQLPGKRTIAMSNCYCFQTNCSSQFPHDIVLHANFYAHMIPC